MWRKGKKGGEEGEKVVTAVRKMRGKGGSTIKRKERIQGVTGVKEDDEENRVHEVGVKEEKRGRQEEKSEGGRGLGKLKWEGRTTRQLAHYYHNTFIYVYFGFVTFYTGFVVQLKFVDVKLRY